MITRRAVLALAAAAPGLAAAHDPFGRVEPPKPAPRLMLLDAAERRSVLSARLLGRVTAVQLMFTTCSATCPLQGALFGAIAPLLRHPDARLLSLSIDPLNDDPKALALWLKRFAPATSTWQAAAPRIADVDRLFELVSGRAAGPDRHSTQVYLFDRTARLVYRTSELPPPSQVAQLIETIAAS